MFGNIFDWHVHGVYLGFQWYMKEKKDQSTDLNRESVSDDKGTERQTDAQRKREREREERYMYTAAGKDRKTGRYFALFCHRYK